MSQIIKHFQTCILLNLLPLLLALARNTEVQSMVKKKSVFFNTYFQILKFFISQNMQSEILFWVEIPCQIFRKPGNIHELVVNHHNPSKYFSMNKE